MGASRVNSSLELDVIDVCEGALLANAPEAWHDLGPSENWCTLFWGPDNKDPTI